MTDETEKNADKTAGKMLCRECGNEKKASELSPAVVDNKMKLVCAGCWDAAVESGRATIFTREELTTFSELK